MADLKEAHQLSFDQEINHWWIRTRFLYIDKAIRRLPNMTETIDALEFGCGTGQNLYYLTQLSPYRARIASAFGIDPQLKDATTPFWGSEKVQLVQSVPAQSAKANLLLAMDVLEHIENDQGALNEWKQHLKPGGIALITVPAFQLLWSYQDKFLGHFRRYRRRDVMALAAHCGFEVIYCRYIFSWAFPIVFIARKILGRNKEGLSADLKPTHPILNWFFFLAGKIEYLVRADHLLGTSVVAIIKKN
ncbi:MAG: hypothetical protein A2X86_18315 [Bdellovibrionales bacterium GWA2_49_15]|nr:MAG: hypothetical protein A2X86_18315 [Bdellovibrionales bacterium GWA2_49_15]HAZ11679.1 hypothetical protein [Bdellovibrionales bacterium]